MKKKRINKTDRLNKYSLDPKHWVKTNIYDRYMRMARKIQNHKIMGQIFD
jgi:hypothetical protein